jgi:hypothetical protein
MWRHGENNESISDQWLAWQHVFRKRREEIGAAEENVESSVAAALVVALEIESVSSGGSQPRRRKSKRKWQVKRSLFNVKWRKKWHRRGSNEMAASSINVKEKVSMYQ